MLCSRRQMQQKISHHDCFFGSLPSNLRRLVKILLSAPHHVDRNSVLMSSQNASTIVGALHRKEHEVAPRQWLPSVPQQENKISSRNVQNGSGSWGQISVWIDDDLSICELCKLPASLSILHNNSKLRLKAQAKVGCCLLRLLPADGCSPQECASQMFSRSGTSHLGPP